MINLDFFEWDSIEVGNKTSGQVKTLCPNCSHTRSNKKDKCLSVNLDSGVANCFYCSKKSIRDFKKKLEVKKFDLPSPNWTNHTSISDKVLKFLESRKISQKTIIECKVTEEEYYQPALGKKVANIVFNYFEGDTLVNKKYRSADKKFTQSKNTKNIFYGINDVIGEKECYIVEGEFDKLALWEVGKKNCISVPNGANDNDDVWKTCEQYLSSIEKFFICTDMDEKGNDIAEKIAQRLGRYRCERITFKNKDANDDLIESVFTLEDSLNNPKKYPVSGTFKVEDLEDNIYKLYDNGLPDTIYPKGDWFDGMGEMFSVMRGHLVTGTGIPSHGKSNFTDWYVLNLLQDYGMKASWFSPEHHPMELHQSNLMQKFYGKPFFKSMDGVDRITRPEIEKYKQWANEKVYLTAPEQNESPTWDWLFEKFKEQIYGYGIDIFIVDAFNKVLFDKTGDNRHLIGEVLTRLTSFAQQNNVIIFLIAHPTKMKKNDSGVYDMPNLYDVSGSADFRNQTHDGFCIYRVFEDENNAAQTIFKNLKTKFSFQGEIGATKNFKYHLASGRYYVEGNPYNSNCLLHTEEPEQLSIQTKTVWEKAKDFDEDSLELITDDAPF
jgi:twinkle protein